MTSLARLDQQHGPYDAIVVAAGAASGAIAEAADLLPLTLAHGFTLEMVPSDAGTSVSRADACNGAVAQSLSTPSGPAARNGDSGVSSAERPGAGYPPGAPSLLGHTYLAAHGSNSIVVGATKSFGLTPSQALMECRPDKVTAATSHGVLPPLASQELHIKESPWRSTTLASQELHIKAIHDLSSLSFDCKLSTCRTPRRLWTRMGRWLRSRR